MKKLSKGLLFGCIALTATLVSCSSEELEYIPFKSTENGGWGLIDSKGKVKFEGEFKRSMTAANHGAFFYKNNDGLWDLYSTKEKTLKPIATGYAEAGAFISEVAPVVKEGERITLINTKGEVQVTLDKAEGKPIEKCTNFYEGLARIYTADGWGVIDTSGKVIVKPQYERISECNAGMMIAKGGGEKEEIYFIDKDGKVTATLDSEKYYIWSDRFGDGLIGVREREDDRCGLMDASGKWVLDPSAKIKSIPEISGKNCIFTDSDGKYGVMDTKGKTLISPVYEGLYFVCGGDLLVGSTDRSENMAILMDLKEKTYERGTLKGGWACDMFPNAVFLSFSRDIYQMFSPKGKEIKPDCRIYRVMDSYDMMGDSEIDSQFVDVDGLVKALDIRENGIAGLTLDQTPKTAIAKMYETLRSWGKEYTAVDLSETKSDFVPEPEDYRYRSTINDGLNLSSFKSDVVLSVKYPSDVVDYNISYSEGEYEYYPTTHYTYFFKDIKPEYVEASVSCPSEGVGKQLWDTLTSNLKSLGNVQISEKGELLIKTSEGYLKLYATSETEIKVMLSKNSDGTSGSSNDDEDEPDAEALVEEAVADSSK